jgi:hypothetical protein
MAQPTGSCYCLCPPGEGYGVCANVYDNSTSCDVVALPVPLPRDVCPAFGRVQQCGGFWGAAKAEPTSCYQWRDSTYYDCDAVEACPNVTRAPLDTQVCSCRPKPAVRFLQHSCHYQPVSCEDTRSAAHGLRRPRFDRV